MKINGQYMTVYEIDRDEINVNRNGKICKTTGENMWKNWK